MTVTKRELRQQARRTRAAIAPETATTAAESAASHLTVLLSSVTTVALYAPVRGELDTRPAAHALRLRGARVLYPRVIPGERTLAFHQVDDPSELIPGAFSVPEPHAGAAFVELSSIDAFVVPGLAFDRTGTRLGWGKGHYDATLAEARGMLIGYTYSCQLMPSVPRDQQDVLMQWLVDETGHRKCAENPEAEQ